MSFPIGPPPGNPGGPGWQQPQPPQYPAPPDGPLAQPDRRRERLAGPAGDRSRRREGDPAPGQAAHASFLPCLAS